MSDINEFEKDKEKMQRHIEGFQEGIKRIILGQYRIFKKMGHSENDFLKWIEDKYRKNPHPERTLEEVLDIAKAAIAVDQEL